MFESARYSTRFAACFSQLLSTACAGPSIATCPVVIMRNLSLISRIRVGWMLRLSSDEPQCMCESFPDTCLCFSAVFHGGPPILPGPPIRYGPRAAGRAVGRRLGTPFICRILLKLRGYQMGKFYRKYIINFTERTLSVFYVRLWNVWLRVGAKIFQL